MPKTVLAVDDDSTVFPFYEICFRHTPNYKLLTSANPLDAFRIIDESAKSGKSIDLVITDLNMPQLGGLDLIRNAHVVSRQTRFMLCTGIEKSAAERLIVSLRGEGIEVKYLPPSYLWDTDKMLGEVRSVIEE